MAKKIADNELRQLALVGAQARLQALEEQIAALVATFPELRGGRGRTGRRESQAAADTPARRRTQRKPGRKTPMTAAERKAVSERMRKYWAERRAKK